MFSAKLCPVSLALIKSIADEMIWFTARFSSVFPLKLLLQSASLTSFDEFVVSLLHSTFPHLDSESVYLYLTLFYIS